MPTGWTSDIEPFDAPAILRTLDDHGVRYVLVGGVAAIAHGYAGATFDADIVPERRQPNLGRLASALRELRAQPYADPRRTDLAADGAPPEAGKLDLGDPASLLKELLWFFSTSAGRLDVLLVIDGPGGYEPLAARASMVRIAGVDVPVASLDDLIESKVAAGREKDLRMVAELRRLRRG